MQSVLCFLTNRHIFEDATKKILLHDVREAQIHIEKNMWAKKKNKPHNQIRNRPIEIRDEMNNVLFGVLLMTWIFYMCLHVCIFLHIYWSVVSRSHTIIQSKRRRREKKTHHTQRILCTHSTLNDFYTLRSI